MGGSSASEEPFKILLDESNNVYSIGAFDYDMDIDPGFGEQILIASGEPSLYLQKLTEDGDFIWVYQFGGDGCEYVYGDFCLDSMENIILTGSFTGTMTLNNQLGTDVFTAVGATDSFTLKLAASVSI